MNEVERLKKEKSGLEVLADIRRYASTGFASITDDDLVRMRWYGLYQQKPKEDGYFMLRVKIPGGELTSAQAREIGLVANEFGRGITDITTRQNFQFHWLTIHDIPTILDRFNALGLTSVGACGDIPRNITSCPAEGISPHGVFDARPYMLAVHEFFLGNEEFADLPRKYKLAISGCSLHCAQPEINDVAATPALREYPDGSSVEGFHVRVGGGLSARPFFAKQLNMWVPGDKLVDVFRAICEVYRDNGNRDNRKKARIKFLVDEWGIERFEEEVRKRLEWTPEPALDILDPAKNFRDHMGVQPQTQEGFFTVGAVVLTGRMTGDQIIEAARLAAEYGDGSIRTTNQQHFLIPFVPKHNVEALTDGLSKNGFPVKGSPSRQAAVACTGSEFCNLALTETKLLMREIVDHLDATVSIDEPLRINLNGCPNSCGQHHVGDIGLQGCLVQAGTGKVDGYDISLGGRLGRDAKFVRPIKRKVPATDVAAAIENLLKGYMAEKDPEEDFSAFVDRHSNEELGTLLGFPPAVEA